MPQRRFKIHGGTVIAPNKTVQDGTLWIEGERIAHIGNKPPDNGPWEAVDAAGLIVSPGFVDVHVHGGGGADFMDADPNAAVQAALFHASGGTTSLVAALGTDSLENWMRMIEAVQEAAQQADGARMLGVHIEGGYFHPNRRGCHLKQHIRNPSPDETRRLLTCADEIRWITLAPELPGAEHLIRAFSERGIVVSAGHSEATFPQMKQAVKWGLRHSTHLYNAMSSVVKIPPARYGGVVEAALLLDEITAEIIADGLHLPAELMQLAYKCKGAGGLAVITDATRASGMPDGEYVFGRKEEGFRFLVKDGVATAPDGSGYAGSVIQMIDAVRVAVELIGVSLGDAVAMASSTPAAILGEEKRIGSLEAGKLADVVLFSTEEWKVERTFVAGREAYART
ncbi:MAG: N-acetylglucosamine-6-phosphate deacetylase [Candidatus Poribacteria bacterium]|nr:N-acetylglucosamine-6-phosphate deacetylase [Candidatus Poribacteria bacterium]